MGNTRVKLRDLGRYQKKYPLVRNTPRFSLVSDSEVEIETRTVPINATDTVNVTWEIPFSGVPNVVVGFIESVAPVSVNVYVESVTTLGCTVRTSSATNGDIAIQAIYIP